MVTIADNLLRDNKFSMMFRVSLGAALSTIDAATDIYVLLTYYRSNELVTQANSLLAMISANLLIQQLLVIGQYKNKSFGVRVRESLVSLFFLRPMVDAYRGCFSGPSC